MHSESFTITVIGNEVHGTLRLPSEEPGEEPWPAVLICDRFPGAAGLPDFLRDDLATAMARAGIAVARFETDGQDSAVDPTATALVDEASATFRWLLMRDEIDTERIGILGWRLGSIVAACLSARTDHISALCLITPATSSYLAAQLAKPNGAKAFLDTEALSESFIASLGELTPEKDIAIHDRPTLILHGSADKTLKYTCAEPYRRALEQAGRDVRFELVARGDEQLASDDVREACCERIAEFFSLIPEHQGSGRT